MFENNNKWILIKLCRKISDKNRMRNMFLYLAILLSTTLLIMTILIGSNALKTINYYESGEHIEEVKEMDGNSYVGLTRMKTNSYKVNSVVFQPIDTEALQFGTKKFYKVENLILNVALSSEYFKNEDITLTNGRFPSSKDEVLLPENISEKLIGVKIGDSVTVSTSISSDIENSSASGDYKVVGFYESKDNNRVIYSGNMTLIISGRSVMISILALVVIAAYLILYNIFYIHVITDNKIYEFLRIVGVKSRDISKIIYYQGLGFSIISIPLGLLLGTVTSRKIAPKIISLTGYEMIEPLSMPLISYLITVLIIILIIKVSCNEPGIYASTIDIYKEEVLDQYRKTFNYSLDRGKIRIKNIAFQNLFRNRKKAYLTISSVVLSALVLIFSVNSYMSLDPDKIVNISLSSDIRVYHKVVDYNILGYRAMDKEMINELRMLHGVKDINTIYEDILNKDGYYSNLKNVEYDNNITQEINGNYSKELTSIDITFIEGTSIRDKEIEVKKIIDKYKNNQIFMKGKYSLRNDISILQRGMARLGYMVSLIVGLIALLNVVNSTITSILSRSKEFAVLRSIGMRQKDIRNMILIEGYYNFLISSIPISMLGMLVIAFSTLAIPYSIKLNDWYKVFSIFVALIFVFLINTIVPYIGFKYVSKKDLVVSLNDVSHY